MTIWSQQITNLVHQAIPSLALANNNFLGSEMILFMSAGLGTAWGLTTAGVFGLKRRYLVSSLMGIISYGIGYFAWQFVRPEYGAEGILVGVVVAITLLTFGLGLRSHYIVYAIIAAYGTAITLSFAIAFGVLPILRFSHPLGWDDLWRSFAFFGFTGVCISLWLAISYYLLVPILRLIGWR